MKLLTVTIKDNATGISEEFETNGIMGAFINQELGDNKSDTSQFIMGDVPTKEFIKLLSGCMNLTYFKLLGDIGGSEMLIKMASQIAKAGYLENTYKKGY